MQIDQNHISSNIYSVMSSMMPTYLGDPRIDYSADDVRDASALTARTFLMPPDLDRAAAAAAADDITQVIDRRVIEQMMNTLNINTQPSNIDLSSIMVGGAPLPTPQITTTGNTLGGWTLGSGTTTSPTFGGWSTGDGPRYGGPPTTTGNFFTTRMPMDAGDDITVTYVAPDLVLLTDIGNRINSWITMLLDQRRQGSVGEVIGLMGVLLTELESRHGINIQRTIVNPIPQAPPPLQIEEEVRNLEPV